jgi:tetratricopeptide (TPR) repeat protein
MTVGTHPQSSQFVDLPDLSPYKPSRLMAKEFKLTRKEIKEPDPFVRVSSAAWGWVMERRRQAVIGLIVLAVGVVAFSAGSHLIGSRERRAGEALSDALDQARRGVEGIDYAVPGDPPLFKSTQERNEAVTKALEKVKSDHPNTRAALTATLHLGSYALMAGRYDDAQRDYQEYLNASKPDDAFRVLALEGLGYTAEAKKDYPGALEWFERMAKDSTKGFGKDRAAYHRARILEEMGKRQEAAQGYEAVKKDFADSPVAKAATERLGLLAMQGVVAQASAPSNATAADAGTG